MLQYLHIKFQYFNNIYFYNSIKFYPILFVMIGFVVPFRRIKNKITKRIFMSILVSIPLLLLGWGLFMFFGIWFYLAIGVKV